MAMDMSMNISMSHREIRARTTDKPDPESHRNHSQNRRQTRARSTEKPEPEPQRNHSRQIHRETRVRTSVKPEPDPQRNQSQNYTENGVFAPKFCDNECPHVIGLYHPIRITN